MRLPDGLLIAGSLLLAAASLGHACTAGGECDDGNPCNGVETCQAGICTSGYPLDCSDGDPDTMEWCDPLSGCRHQLITSFAECDDPNAAGFTWAQSEGACTCADAATHGEYVSCVVRAAARFGAGSLPSNCRGNVRRCAARSTCGKPSGSVACCMPRAEGRTRCSTKRSPEACVRAGGSPSTGSCCDVVCALP